MSSQSSFCAGQSAHKLRGECASMGWLSIWQAIFEIACQWKTRPIQPLLSQIDRGRENQRLKSVIQAVILATAMPLSLGGNCFRAGFKGSRRSPNPLRLRWGRTANLSAEPRVLIRPPKSLASPRERESPSPFRLDRSDPDRGLVARRSRRLLLSPIRRLENCAADPSDQNAMWRIGDGEIHL